MSPLALLKELIAIPSVNPMGRTLDPSVAYEGRLSDYLVGLFLKRGIECERTEVQPGRDNVLARVLGSAGMPTILLDAHQDTVPVDDITIHPFDPVVDEGRIYGRGACDVKGGMAAMICALDRLAQSDPTNRPTVVLACTCDEELNQRGAEDVACAFSHHDNNPSKLLQGPPDMAVVAEPTRLNVGVAHRGVVRWEIRTYGRSVHSSDPSRGENAIYRMAKLVTELERYAEAIASDSASADFPCGPKTLSVGVITGGQSVNIVPAMFTIVIDRRTLPGEDASAEIYELGNFLRKRLDFDFEMLRPTTVAAPLPQDNNRELAKSLHEAAKPFHPASKIVGLPFTTHAPRYAQAGVPTVVFGPGAIEQAHTANEWLAIEQLNLATDILFEFLSRVCSSTRS